MNFLEHFWARVDDSADCWVWMGPRNNAGYGMVNVRRGRVSTHRIAWELANAREIPAGMLVMHSCDVRACVRPSHLSLGTVSDNAKDMLAKGRGRCPPRMVVVDGERMHAADLARRLGMSRQLLNGRLARGWSLKEATAAERRVRSGR